MPGVFTTDSPTRAASPDRGCTNAAYPGGSAIATPVPTTARSPGASSRSLVVTRSAPASPGRAYAGSATSGSTLVNSTSTVPGVITGSWGSTGSAAGTAGETTLTTVTDSPPAASAATTATTVFDERLRVPLWWWLPAMGVAALLAAEVHMGYPGVRAWLPYLVLVPLAATVLLVLGRTRVRLTDDGLTVGQATLPLEFVGEVEVVPRAGKRRALGPDSDPAAFMLHRTWIGPMLLVRLTDPADPTPYWIFSLRRPERLAELLRTGTGGGRRES